MDISLQGLGLDGKVELMVVGRDGGQLLLDFWDPSLPDQGPPPVLSLLSHKKNTTSTLHTTSTSESHTVPSAESEQETLTLKNGENAKN